MILVTSAVSFLIVVKLASVHIFNFYLERSIADVTIRNYYYVTKTF